MDGRVVERVLGPWDTQETCALLECRGSETRHLLQLGAGGESTILLAIIDDVLGEGGTKATDVHQQVLGGRVEIHAHIIDTTLDGLIQGVLEFCLIDIVLVLSHANAFGVDLHQFGQRIHETTADGDGPADSDILVREFLAGDFRGGIDGGSSLRDYEDLWCISLVRRGRNIVAASEDILDETGGLAAGRTITY